MGMPDHLPRGATDKEKIQRWLVVNVYMGRTGRRAMDDDLCSPQCLAVWCMTTKTAGFREDHVGSADPDSLGAQIARKLVSASDNMEVDEE